MTNLIKKCIIYEGSKNPIERSTERVKKWIIDVGYADGSELHIVRNVSFDKNKWTDEHSERIAMQIWIANQLWIANQSDYDCVWYSLEFKDE